MFTKKRKVKEPTVLPYTLLDQVDVIRIIDFLIDEETYKMISRHFISIGRPTLFKKGYKIPKFKSLVFYHLYLRPRPLRNLFNRRVTGKEINLGKSLVETGKWGRRNFFRAGLFSTYIRPRYSFKIPLFVDWNVPVTPFISTKNSPSIINVGTNQLNRVEKALLIAKERGLEDSVQFFKLEPRVHITTLLLDDPSEYESLRVWVFIRIYKVERIRIRKFKDQQLNLSDIGLTHLKSIDVRGLEEYDTKLFTDSRVKFEQLEYLRLEGIKPKRVVSYKPLIMKSKIMVLDLQNETSGLTNEEFLRSLNRIKVERFDYVRTRDSMKDLFEIVSMYSNFAEFFYKRITDFDTTSTLVGNYVLNFGRYLRNKGWTFDQHLEFTKDLTGLKQTQFVYRDVSKPLNPPFVTKQHKFSTMKNVTFEFTIPAYGTIELVRRNKRGKNEPFSLPSFASTRNLMICRIHYKNEFDFQKVQEGYVENPLDTKLQEIEYKEIEYNKTYPTVPVNSDGYLIELLFHFHKEPDGSTTIRLLRFDLDEILLYMVQSSYLLLHNNYKVFVLKQAIRTLIRFLLSFPTHNDIILDLVDHITRNKYNYLERDWPFFLLWTELINMNVVNVEEYKKDHGKDVWWNTLKNGSLVWMKTFNCNTNYIISKNVFGQVPYVHGKNEGRELLDDGSNALYVKTVTGKSRKVRFVSVRKTTDERLLPGFNIVEHKIVYYFDAFFLPRVLEKNTNVFYCYYDNILVGAIVWKRTQNTRTFSRIVRRDTGKRLSERAVNVYIDYLIFPVGGFSYIIFNRFYDYLKTIPRLSGYLRLQGLDSNWMFYKTKLNYTAVYNSFRKEKLSLEEEKQINLDIEKKIIPSIYYNEFEMLFYYKYDTEESYHDSSRQIEELQTRYSIHPDSL